MFTHYYRYKSKYLAKVISADERLKIVYPTDEHSMITVGHDFYVIGTFHGLEISSDAELKVELKELETETVVRTVSVNKKDNRAGINVHYAGIETAEEEEVIRSCGMPDLVYDPEKPESFWHTWNKAYYTDQVFSALIYGGTCQLEGICPYDQFGNKLTPLKEGYYELRVTLKNNGEYISSAKTVWITEGQKEIILSRFSPDLHVERVKQFVDEEGFEAYTDPYAGIWDTQFFSIDWPVKAWVEIPARWHFGDAQEYESGTVHFFNFNISEACVSWKTEIGTMLAKDRDCVDNPERLLTYYYKNGCPDIEIEHTPAGTLGIMEKNQYFSITRKTISKAGTNTLLEIEAICKPLPSDTNPVSGCAYDIENRLEYMDYHFYSEDSEHAFFISQDNKIGVISEKEDAPDELLVLHAHHKIIVASWPSDKTIRIVVTAKDSQGQVWEQQTTEVPH